MLGLLKNEFEKIFFRKKLIIAFLGLLLLSGAITFGICSNKKQMEKYNDPKFMIENMSQDLNRLKVERDAAPEGEKEKLNSIIADIERQIEEQKRFQAVKDTDWKKALGEQNKTIEEQIKTIKGPDAEMQIESMNTQLKINKYLLENNVEPKPHYDINAYDVTLELMGILGTIFIILVAALLSSDIVSSEYTPPTMKVLLTRPVSRGKILFSKYITALLSTIAVVLTVELIVYLVIGLAFSFGNGNYPMLVGAKFKYNPIISMNRYDQIIQIAGSSYIIPLWKYLVESILMQMLFITASVSFFFLLSTILKSSMISMAVSILSSIGLLIVTQTGLLAKISPFIFVIYGDTSSILNGNIAQRVRNPLVTPGFSIITLLVWTIISYTLAHVIFKKKDILI